VTATGDRPFPVMWGQHLAYGPPFLVPGTRLSLPDGVAVRPHPGPINPPRRRFAPEPGRYPMLRGADGNPVDLRDLPSPGAESDILYAGPFADPGWYEVTRPDGVTLRVEWGTEALPDLWLWYELGATVGAPWYGTLVAIGLEPNSSWPTNGLAEAVANGSALRIDPGQTLDSWYTVEVRS
jgi:urease beta subunit